MKPLVDPRTGRALGGINRALPNHIIIEPEEEEDLPLAVDLVVSEEVVAPPPIPILLDNPPEPSITIEEINIEKLDTPIKQKRNKKKKTNAISST